MNEVSILQKMDQGLTSIKQLGLYKLLFSQKVAFCFVLLFISTAIVVFSAWAVCKHVIDSSTFGTVIVTFGGITATLAGVYNIVHALNDRTAMQITADTNTATALAATNTATATALAATNTAAATAVTVAATDTATAATVATVATVAALTPLIDPTLPPNGTL
jgi:hypothetical protein